MVMALLGMALTLYGVKEVGKTAYNKSMERELRKNNIKDPKQVIEVIGGEKIIDAQPQAVKKRYINYLHKEYGLNNKEKQEYEEKFNKYIKARKKVQKKQKQQKANKSYNEYIQLKNSGRWRDNGNVFKITLHDHCSQFTVEQKMNKTINNTFLKEIINKSWIYNGNEILEIRNVNRIHKGKIKDWYKSCWIKENGSWRY